jgi:ABC-type polysaccharide/polyol phosphate export permease
LLRTFLNLNPMTHIMQGYQNCVFYGSLIHWKKLGVTFIASLILFIVGYTIFDRLRDSFPEEV